MLASILFILSPLVAAWAGNSATDTLSASDFSSDMGPFFDCTYRLPSIAEPVSGRLKVYFDESDYDGTRVDRGIEICVDRPNVHKELWQGFNLWVPSDTYPYGKQSIIAQQFCDGYCSSWCGTLSIIDNSLVVDHRASCGTPTEEVIVANIERDTWHPIVINSRFSNIEDGRYVVYYDGSVVYNSSNINLGFDDSWTTNGSMTTGVGFKNGQYNAGELWP